MLKRGSYAHPVSNPAHYFDIRHAPVIAEQHSGKSDSHSPIGLLLSPYRQSACQSHDA